MIEERRRREKKEKNLRWCVNLYYMTEYGVEECRRRWMRLSVPMQA
jgi:hypothetical protein